MYFHHGDCIGADAEAHQIALDLGYCVVLHPPDIDVKRAFCKGAYFVHPPLPYLKRNHVIAETVDPLLVAPKTMVEQLRSGTWATYRHAMKIDESEIILLER